MRNKYGEVKSPLVGGIGTAVNFLKLLGAGGGGFLSFYCPKERQIRLREKLRLKPFPFKFEHDGSSVVYIGDKYWE